MKREDSARAETQEVLEAFRRIVRAVRISSRFTEDRMGLSSAQIFVLQKLSHEDGLSLNELAARTLTHQSSVSVVVSKLVLRGLVRRRKSSVDGRKVVLSVTPLGRSMAQRAPEPVQDALIRAVRALPGHRRALLADSLAQVVRQAGLIDGPAPMMFEDKNDAS